MVANLGRCEPRSPYYFTIFKRFNHRSERNSPPVSRNDPFLFSLKSGRSDFANRKLRTAASISPETTIFCILRCYNLPGDLSPKLMFCHRCRKSRSRGAATSFNHSPRIRPNEPPPSQSKRVLTTWSRLLPKLGGRLDGSRRSNFSRNSRFVTMESSILRVANHGRYR